MPDLTPWQWTIALLTAVIVGAAKTGIPGLGFLAVPALALIFRDAKASAGILLPLLCLADLLAVWWYRRHAAAHRLWELLPWTAVGMGAGAACLWWVDGQRLMPWLGGIILAMIALHLWRQRHPDPPAPGFKTTAGFGFAAGGTTTIANAAGPVMNLYLLAKRLPKDEFIATGAWFFFIINLAKLPIYATAGIAPGKPAMINGGSLLIDLCLAPAVVLGALVGRRVVDRIPQRAFERTVLALAAAAALWLIVKP
jgi:uncharacterized membrane protein YfcA